MKKKCDYLDAIILSFDYQPLIISYRRCLVIEQITLTNKYFQI